METNQLSLITVNSEKVDVRTRPGLTQDTSSSRREYLKLYYQKNKEELKQKRQEKKLKTLEQSNSEGNSGMRHKQSNSGQWLRLLHGFEFILFVFLSASLTYYLVHESAKFYLDAQESTLSAYFKAAVVEGIAVLFSFSRAKGAVLRWTQRLVVVSFCCLTLWTMSERLVNNAVQSSSKAQTTAKMVMSLESELSQKEALRNEYLNRGYLTATRRYERGIDQIREKLLTARKSLAEMQTPHVIAGSLGVLILFRLLLVAANLVSVHRIVEFLSLDSGARKQKAPA